MPPRPHCLVGMPPITLLPACGSCLCRLRCPWDPRDLSCPAAGSSFGGACASWRQGGALADASGNGCCGVGHVTGAAGEEWARVELVVRSCGIGQASTGHSTKPNTRLGAGGLSAVAQYQHQHQQGHGACQALMLRVLPAAAERPRPRGLPCPSLVVWVAHPAHSHPTHTHPCVTAHLCWLRRGRGHGGARGGHLGRRP